jgi:hypothetical protein
MYMHHQVAVVVQLLERCLDPTERIAKDLGSLQSERLASMTRQASLVTLLTCK